MKKPNKDVNLTVITIILIGIIVAVTIPIITNVLNVSDSKKECAKNNGTYINGQCQK